MSGSKSDYLEKTALDTFIGGQTYNAPANLYIALFTTGSLTDASTGATTLAQEVTGGGYARKAVPNDLSQWPAAAINGSGQTEKHNANTITFNAATADWGSVTQWAICDASINGNVLYWGTFDVAKTILAGDTATIPAQSLKIFED